MKFARTVPRTRGAMNAIVGGTVVALILLVWSLDTDPTDDALFLATNQQSTKAASVLDLSPSVKSLIINVGSNIDPIMPHPKLGPCARTIAVEPVAACDVPPHPQLDVLSAAVTGTPGIATMNVYNVNGESSSLSKPAKKDGWNSRKKRQDGRKVLVPLVTMATLLTSIPSHTTIEFLKTDMQGYDFVAISSVGELLKRHVAFLQTEVWFEDVYTYYAENDLCRDWFPYMTKLGYEVVHTNRCGTKESIPETCRLQLEKAPVRPPVSPETAGVKECDVTWRLIEKPGGTSPTPSKDDLFVKFRDAKEFTEEEYNACG